MLLGLQACTTVNVDIPTLQAELPQQFDSVAPRPLDGDQADTSRWWQTLNDPVLSEFIEEGLRNNTDVRVALARIKEARAYLGVAESAYYPTVDAQMGADRSRQTGTMPPQSMGLISSPLPVPMPSSSLNPNTGMPLGNTTAAGLNATWEVDVFGARHSDAEMVHQLVLGAQEQKHGAQLLVASDIATHYFEARGAERRLEVLQRGVDVAKRLNKYAEGRFKAGQTNASEVDRALLQVDFTQAQVEPLRALLASHVRRIAVLMGRPPQGLQSLPAQPASARLPPSLPSVLPSDVLERRPDVRGAARKLRSQAAKLGSAKAELMPKFYIGFGGLAGRFHPDNQDGSNFSTQMLGIGVRLPIFDAGRIRSNIAANQAQLEGLAAQYEQSVLTALEDVENAYTAQRAFEVRHELVLRAATLARRVADHKNSLFVSGQDLLQPALEAEATALQRADDAVQSETSRSLYTVLLYKALGGGWSSSKDEMAAPSMKTAK